MASRRSRTAANLGITDAMLASAKSLAIRLPAVESIQPGEPGAWTIRVPGWHPPTLNELMHCHHMKAQRLKDAARDVLGYYASLAGVPPAVGRRRLDLTIVLGPRQRGADPDAFFKSTCDALKRLGLLVDDSKEWVVLPPVEYGKAAEKATTIVLTDLED